MTDEELLLQAAGLPTFYLDGFGAVRKINGVLRFVGYIIGSGAQVNLIVSTSGSDVANREIRRVLDDEPIKGTSTMDRPRLSH